MKFTLKKTLKATMLITTAMLGLASTATVAMAKETLGDAARLYKQGNYKEAARIFKDYAEKGVATAQFYLGVMYDEGQGVAQDYRQAAKWHQKAAEQGMAEAQFYIGAYYYQGQGVKKNIKTAKKWFDKSCKNGVQGACEILSN